MIDARSYRAFVADKGFSPKEIEGLLQHSKDLHFIALLKINDRRISRFSMLNFDNCLRGIDKRVRCKKVALGNGRFLYTFRDSRIAQAEDDSFMDRQHRRELYDNRIRQN